MNNVGLIIKKKREAIGISQNQLAKKANIAQASLNALESKVNNPRVYTLYQLADALWIVLFLNCWAKRPQLPLFFHRASRCFWICSRS